jgi:hypothetical protein
LRRNNRVLQAAVLPTLINLNARSVYNKKREFELLVQQYQADVVFMTETWERDHMPLNQIITGLDNYQIITEVNQRREVGGKSALFICQDKFIVKPLCPDIITVPTGVEVTWALLVTKNNTTASEFRQTAVAVIYCKPRSRKKTALVDHLSESYHYLKARYGSQLNFILAGDTNDLKLEKISQISSDLKQIVHSPTRENRNGVDTMLDPVFTTLHKYYQEPEIKPPLDNDPGNDGKPSDHKIIYVKPISNISFLPARSKKVVKFRPLPSTGIQKMGEWIAIQDWQEVYDGKTAHDKAELFQQMLLQKMDECLPEKSITVTSDDKPWITSEIKQLDRKQKREFCKNRKSAKWIKLNKTYKDKFKQAKNYYYQNIVKDLKNSNPGQWFSKLKRMSSHDQVKNKLPIVQSLIGQSDADQAESIADSFAEISNEYDALTDQVFQYEPPLQTFQHLDPYFVYQKIKGIRKKNCATVPDDIPMKIIQEFADELAFPLANIINRMTEFGEYPNIWKIEIVTPVPKVHPPPSPKELRKISVTKNFSKIAEKIFAECIISDMSSTRDPSQYGNEKGLSVQHYLINMLNKVLTALDTNTTNEAIAVIANFIDWSSAFDRQCPKLAIESFIKNGVRPSLIPVLISYFKNRKMHVKWHGVMSKERQLPGGGPQGCSMGILSYLSQTNNNTDFVNPDERYKFVDDLSLLEVVNLVNIGLSSYNVKSHVPSDISLQQYYISSDNLKSQQYLKLISEWTDNQKMKLNTSKTCVMIFNQTRNYQFSTRLQLNNFILEIVNQTKLLGIIISADLTWHENTKMLVRKGYQRMIILKKLYEFNVPEIDLVIIYMLFIRSILEQSCVVWHPAITVEEEMDLERVQKVALRIILRNRYDCYENALQLTKLQKLSDRRESLCLKFANSCVNNENTKHMFPLNDKDHGMKTRHHEKYIVQFANTKRLAESAIPYLQRLLNEQSD